MWVTNIANISECIIPHKGFALCINRLFCLLINQDKPKSWIIKQKIIFMGSRNIKETEDHLFILFWLLDTENITYSGSLNTGQPNYVDHRSPRSAYHPEFWCFSCIFGEWPQVFLLNPSSSGRALSPQVSIPFSSSSNCVRVLYTELTSTSLESPSLIWVLTTRSSKNKFDFFWQNNSSCILSIY